MTLEKKSTAAGTGIAVFFCTSLGTVIAVGAWNQSMPIAGLFTMGAMVGLLVASPWLLVASGALFVRMFANELKREPEATGEAGEAYPVSLRGKDDQPWLK